MASQSQPQPDDCGKRLPPRDPHGHKGTFGTALIVGGCAPTGSNPNTRPVTIPTTMIGGPALAAAAALRAGAGLARLAMPAPILNAGLIITPEATGIALPTASDGTLHPDATRILTQAAESAHALLIGPGLGQGEAPAALTRAALDSLAPAVILDADAINTLTLPNFPQSPKSARFRSPGRLLILTPHLGEYKRLSQWLGLDDPQAVAARLNAILIIKSATTIIADAERRAEIPGNQPLLATGGTGDILAGMMTGLLAQLIAGGDDPPVAALDPYDLAAIAVRAHQRAAALWADARTTTAAPPLTRGMLAGDLLPWIGPALESL